MSEQELAKIYDLDHMVEIKRGGGGAVFEATKFKTNTKVALKRIIHDRDYSADFPKNEEWELNEYLLTKDLFRHQNLIDYEECFIIPNPV